MQHRAARLSRSLGVATLAGVLALAFASVAGAHEHRELADGQYEISIGFINEPAIAGEPNGLWFSVVKLEAEGEAATPMAAGTPAADEHEDGEDEHAGIPVEGLADTLNAEVSFGGETMGLTIEPAFGEPGVYQSHFIPTAAGAYTFHLFGRIDGVQVDETFTGGPDTFSEVDDPATMGFPATTGADASELDSAALEAQDTADSARTLAIVGLVVGVLGLAVGVGGMLMARNARATTTAARSADASDY